MALSATLIGALLGLGTQMYSNALRKLPYMRPGAVAQKLKKVLGMSYGLSHQLMHLCQNEF